MAMRSVKTLPPRHCEHCGNVYAPRRRDQRFCPSSDCRNRWWRNQWKEGAQHHCPWCRLLHMSDGSLLPDDAELVRPPAASASRNRVHAPRSREVVHEFDSSIGAALQTGAPGG